MFDRLNRKVKAGGLLSCSLFGIQGPVPSHLGQLCVSGLCTAWKWSTISLEPKRSWERSWDSRWGTCRGLHKRSSSGSEGFSVGYPRGLMWIRPRDIWSQRYLKVPESRDEALHYTSQRVSVAGDSRMHRQTTPPLEEKTSTKISIKNILPTCSLHVWEACTDPF